MTTRVPPRASSASSPRSAALSTPQKLLHRNADILRDLPKKGGRDVVTGVERHRGAPTIWMPILLVRAPLPNLGEPESLKERHDLPRFQGGQVAHYATLTVCTPTNSDSSFGSPSSRSMATTS